jgi:hypothetical protein
MDNQNDFIHGIHGSVIMLAILCILLIIKECLALLVVLTARYSLSKLASLYYFNCLVFW